jgi:hypothetical protein
VKWSIGAPSYRRCRTTEVWVDVLPFGDGIDFGTGAPG